MNPQPSDLRPYPYYTVMRQSQDPKMLRLRMALHAKEHGVKPAARAFHTTVKTVRKWLKRFDGKIASLEAQSRAPKRRPRKLPAAAEKKILDAKRRCPRFSAKRLKLEFELSHSVKAIRRICKEHGLNRPWRRKKTQTKRLLRDIKKQWKLFQQIDVDTKNLCDIPEYWLKLKGLGLPQYQYTARDVSTGLLFLGYSNELSLSYATLFAERIIQHLLACGHDLAGASRVAVRASW